MCHLHFHNNYSILDKTDFYKLNEIINPKMTFSTNSNLQRIKYKIIPRKIIINLFSSTMRFILYNTTTHIISETKYPIKVAIEAPSIPILGIKAKRLNTLIRKYNI